MNIAKHATTISHGEQMLINWKTCERYARLISYYTTEDSISIFC